MLRSFFIVKVKCNVTALLVLLNVTLLCGHVFAETTYIPKSDFDSDDINAEINENLAQAIGKMGYEEIDYSNLITILETEGLYDLVINAFDNMGDSPQFLMIETGLSGTKYLISAVYFDDIDDIYCFTVHDFEPVVFDKNTLGKTNMFYWAIDNIGILLVSILLAAAFVLFTKFIYPKMKERFPLKLPEDAMEEHMENAKWWKRKYKWNGKKEKNALIINLTSGVLWAVLISEVIIIGSIIYSGFTTYTVQKLIPSFTGTREEIEIQAADYIAENITYQEGVHGDLSMGYTVYLFRFIPIPIPICFPPDSYKVINDKLGDCDEMTFLWMKILQKSGIFDIEMTISDTEQHAWAYDKKTGLYWDVTWYENTNRNPKWLKMTESYYPVEKTLITL